jgi:superfamily II DNA or RNA helicase
LEEAINAGQLTPYNYYPVLVYLTNEEEEEFIELSKKISKMSQYEKSADNSLIEILLIKRAKIIAGAKNKLPSLEKLLVDENLIRTQDNLFYCAATKDEENETKMVDQVYKMLSRKGMIIDKFTSFDADSKTKRKNLINNLADNTIDGLVAIKCLDEGVDIPSVKRAFILSSSTNPKEFIQRRGRVLRKFKGKDFAEIYDFMVIPSGSSSKEEVKFQKKYLENELKRYREFAKLALNYPACEKPLIDLAAKYNLLHI